ncbi:guanine nucleotide-binding protein subunit alpha-14-like [Clavelina lepadiformis]|uniref:guanine nucleotide-binding protein subunit alpha-14-like n=1 Tax=Clavelina lepadiformis TaxID=159417 RepID=UPI0040426298
MMANLTSCFKSSVASDAKSISREIEKQLSKDKKEARSQVKLLVLGAAESGKSTFIKQMRIIHGKGYSKEEKQGYTSLIHQNINVSVKVLAMAMENLGVPYEKVENQEIGEKFIDMSRDDESNLDLVKGVEIQKFWDDKGIQMCYLRRNEFHLYDSASYYLNNITRICEESFIPNLQDVLRTRLPTSGIIEYLFDVDRFVFGIVDVGGQKSERRKWIHCFENVTSIIFLAALSEYDQTIPSEEIDQDVRNRFNRAEASGAHAQNNNHRRNPMLRSQSDQHFKTPGRFVTHRQPPKNPVQRQFSSVHNQKPPPFDKKGLKSALPPFPTTNHERYGDSNATPRQRANRLRDIEEEDDTPKINRLTESCALFKTIVQNQFFRNMSVILFLNKTDILDEKIKHSHLVDHFPEFPGQKQDAEAAKEFISEKYGKCFDKMKNSKRTLYTHFTCATDTTNISFVFAAIKDIILQQYLVNYNLV